MKNIFLVCWFSIVISFNSNAAINPPNLSSPSNNATDQKIALPVSWSSVSGATKYHYQFDTSASFNSKWLKQDTISGLSDTIRYLQLYRNYHWRVRALDATQVSTWSSVRTLRTNYMSVVQGNNPQYVTGFLRLNGLGVNFRMQVDTSANFNSGLLHDTLVKDNGGYYIYGATSLMYFKRKYYVRIRVEDRNYTSGWDAYNSFTTINGPLVGKIPYPYSYVLSKNFDIKFEFTKLFEKTNLDTIYNELVLDTSAQFNSPVLKKIKSNTDYALSNGDFFIQGKKYYWKYRVVSAIDTTGWSPVYNIYTQARAELLYPSLSGNNNIDSVGSIVIGMGKGVQYVAFELDTVYNFTAPFWSDTLQNNATAIGVRYVPPFYYNKYQVIRFKVYSIYDTSDWFGYYLSFAKTVTQVSPVTSSYQYVVNPAFSWYRIGNVNYEVQVDTTNKFNSKRLVRFFKDSTGLVSDDLYYGRQHYWRVRAVHKRDSSNWSTVRTFTTTNKISLILPNHKATDVLPSAQLEANPIRGTDTYEIRVSEDSTFATYSSYTLSDKPGYIVYTSLSNFNVQYGKTYFWYIIGRHKRDSVFSDIWKFKVKDPDPIPAKVVLVSPTNNYVDIPYTLFNVTFDWQDNAYTTEYELQYSMSSGFTSNVKTETAVISEIKLFNFSPSADYYWRVRSKNLTGVGPWSDVWTFSTIGVLAVPSQLNPDNASDISLTPKLEWGDVATAKSYDFRIGKSSFLSSEPIYNSTISEAQLQNLTANATYYWQVRSKNQYYVTAWSFVANFMTGNGTSVNNAKAAIGFAVYPNPVAGNEFVLSGKELSEAEIRLYDLKGCMIEFSKYLKSNDAMVISVGENLQGLFILEIQTEQGVSRMRLVFE